MHKLSETECEAMELRYYSPEMHSAAFVVPRFARKALLNNHNTQNEDQPK